MTDLYLACQNVKERQRPWHPVGRLSYENGKYLFLYTAGVEQLPDFLPFSGMPDLEKEYVSEQLFPLFANRILNRKRPEYADYLSWSGISLGEDTDITLLSRTGGIRETDGMEVFPHPVPSKDGCYEMDFFVRGIRYQPEWVQNEIKQIAVGSQLYLCHDRQNPHDKNALLLRTGPCLAVGYVPRYLAEDFLQFLEVDLDHTQVHATRVNANAPTRYRILCRMTAPWPLSFAPCSGAEFQPLAKMT